MAEQSYNPKKYVDFLSDFSGGIDSGVSPLLLPKNQLSMTVNCSLRFGFIHPRPPVVQIPLNFNGNTALAALLQTGLFQGSGYYRPDAGAESLVAVVGGHVIQFQSTGSAWNVTDVSVPGSLGNPATQQVWMWQAEKWMIINDGVLLPVLFDGSTSRRSYGPAVLEGTVTSASSSTIPLQYLPSVVQGTVSTSNTTNILANATIQATLTGIYQGPFNVPVIFNGEYYMATALLQNPAKLTAIHASSPGSVGPGTDIVSKPAFVGYTSNLTFGQPGIGAQTGHTTIPFFFNSPVILGIGDLITIPGLAGNPYTVYAILTGGEYQVFGTAPADHADLNVPIPIGTLIQRVTTAPEVIVGVTAQSFNIPANGSSVQIYLQAPYTGQVNLPVFIGTDYYEISPVSQPAGNVINLTNLTDTGVGNAYTFPLSIYSVPELPVGRMGAYGNGRNWFSLANGITYMAGDIVGGASGTPAYNYRDAVLKTTENDFLANGGVFTLPGTSDQITAMVFPPVLDSSLGLGSLQIFTPFSVFANNAPADRTTWANLAWPIQSETLKDQGALAQDSTIIVNSDTFFRGDINFGSLVLARRQFQLAQWGNKPISDEMQRILELDNQQLLNFSSSGSFDNRFFGTVSPTNTSHGTYHLGFSLLNFDPLSTLRNAEPPVWEGAWEGLNVLKVMVGRVNGYRRCFAFTYNNITGTIELWEQLAESVATQQNIFADNNTTPITWMFETSCIFNEDIHPLTELLQLRDGEVYVSEIQGSVKVSVYYRPDFYPCWTLWNTFTVCSNQTGANANSTYRMRVGLGEPSVTPGELGNNRPLRMGYFFQLRFVVEGACTINGIRASAITAPEPVFAPVNIPATCAAINCTTTPDLSLYSLQTQL